jgi:predicted nucleotide-binding protein (sugar kinase/HSP70/actin superfamily)
MKITFPQMGDYHVPIKIALENIYRDATVILPPPFTTKTLEKGSLHSPDFVCVPFKHNLGNLIEALDLGADTIINAGCCSGCRLDFYGELQEKILKDKGYQFKLVNPFPDLYFNPIATFKIIKSAGKTVSLFKCIKWALVAVRMINCMDKIDEFVRANVGFEITPKCFEKTHAEFLAAMSGAKSIFAVGKIYRTYMKRFKSIPLNKPKNVFRVCLVGELFCLMEPNSNYFMEKELAKFNIEIHREITLSYMMRESHKSKQREIKRAKGYVKYDLGSHGMHSVVSAVEAAAKGFDGIIHLKPFGCMPEVSAMPALINVGKDKNIPILFFSFDSQTSITGIHTRLEAFHDMISMKRDAAKV